ncbi:MAG: methyltransferase [Chitinivibrionales bacterium]|nr:methyltransferase [Chitinivibrionales bacterium]
MAEKTAPRQLVATSLNHRPTARVPVDFGGTAVSGMHVTCVEALRQHYGLERRPVKVCEPYQMLGEIEDDLKDALGIDTVALPAPNTLFGFRNENWKMFRAPWGQELLVSEHFNTTRGGNGDLLIYPAGDTSAPASGRMPAGGFFFDTIIRQEPIDEAALDPSDNLEEFGPLSESDLAYYRDRARELAGSPRAVVGTVPGTAFGDIALVPAPFLKHPRGIRDITEWYMSIIMRPDYVHRVFERQCGIAIENLERVAAVLGAILDVLFVCGTDFGTQTSTFCSTDTYEELYAPYYRRINDWVHTHTTWKTFKHSCGAVESFIPHFIDSGFDIVNPVQCSAVGMDPHTLKERYGDRIVFWGAGVDTQKVLPFGTPDEVRAQVLQRCEVLAPAGGFVFNAIHNVQARTPVENIVAMMDAVREYPRG